MVFWRSAAGVALLLGFTGCGVPEDHPASTYQLRVTQVVGPSGAGDGDLVRRAVADAAGPAVWFSAEGPALPADVRYARLAATDGTAVLRVELEVEVPAAVHNEVAPDLSATVELTRIDGTIEVSRDLPVAIERTVAILDARMTLARGDDAARAALLLDTDPEIVVLTVNWIQTHRQRALADAVAPLAASSVDAVALAAIDCIGAVGGPEHAAQLVRHPKVADRAHANRLYDTLANLGGEHAIGFLEFAARNEEDPEMAGLAAHALVRARAQRGETVTPSATPDRGHRFMGGDA